MCDVKNGRPLSFPVPLYKLIKVTIVLPVILLGLFNVGYEMIKANSYPMCVRGIIVN